MSSISISWIISPDSYNRTYQTTIRLDDVKGVTVAQIYDALWAAIEQDFLEWIEWQSPDLLKTAEQIAESRTRTE